MYSTCQDKNVDIRNELQIFQFYKKCQIIENCGLSTYIKWKNSKINSSIQTKNKKKRSWATTETMDILKMEQATGLICEL